MHNRLGTQIFCSPLKKNLKEKPLYISYNLASHLKKKFQEKRIKVVLSPVIKNLLESKLDTHRLAKWAVLITFENDISIASLISPWPTWELKP